MGFKLSQCGLLRAAVDELRVGMRKGRQTGPHGRHVAHMPGHSLSRSLDGSPSRRSMSSWRLLASATVLRILYVLQMRLARMTPTMTPRPVMPSSRDRPTGSVSVGKAEPTEVPRQTSTEEEVADLTVHL